MKQKIAMILLAVIFMTVGSYAQATAKRVLSQKKMEALTKSPGKKQLKKQPAKKLMQRQTDLMHQQGGRVVMAAHKKADVKTTKRAPRRAEVIYDQPAGELKRYMRSGEAYASSMFGVTYTEVTGAVGTVVFGDGDKVYIKDIVSQAGLGTWVEGTISGSTITIQLPQPIGDSDYGYGFLAAKMEYDDAEDWYVQSTDQTVTLNYNASTGEITSSAELQDGNTLIGIIYDDDFSWMGYGDWNITMTAVTDPLVEAPAGLSTTQYSLTADGYAGSLVNVGFDGSDVYVQGIDKNLPDTWIKGTISGTKVTFNSGQYIGADEVVGYHQYLMAATVTQEYDEYYDEYYNSYNLSDGEITFDYDASTKTLSNSTPFLLNAGKTDVYYLYAFDKAVMKPFTEVAATPATPTNLLLYEGGWNYFQSGYGWGEFSFDLQTLDVDGNYIMPEKMSYKLYTKVNGEVKPLTLSWNDYAYQETETMTEIPYGYNDGWDIYATDNNTAVYYYVIGPEAYGVQAIYRGAGEEHASEIAWADAYELGADVQPAAATPSYTDVTIADGDNRIDYGFYTGDESINTVTNNYKEETYDVAIHLNAPAMVGTAIESITFPLQSVEGVSNLNVFLTSQLRVENGKNAADLVVKNVTPAEAGFITVKLDKAYKIPEGGVYVGYSMTIDDATSEENRLPVTITNKVNEGGFYLHTSDGFLKWLDVAEGFGGSAMIQVTLAGSAIKANAATVADGNTQYVKTGDVFTVPVTVVNHGAKGIQKLDVLYSINGQDGSKQVTTSVDGFFGKSATFNLDIPAISNKGNYELVVKVDKVNGAANEDAISSTTIPVMVLNTVPKKRTLLEEYTGLWCGWCPRGYVGLEKLAELYPDDFVLVSYHNADDMEITYNFPSPVAGFPDAWIDRVQSTDAYFGAVYGEKDMGIADQMTECNKQFGQADVTFTSKLSDDESQVTINSKIIFPYDLTGGNFAVEYILTADGLKDDSWIQSNYYANGADGYHEFMDQFTTATGNVAGLEFNDVAVLTSEILGGANQTITTATADEPVVLSYTFTLADAVNTSSMPVIQDVNKVKVVALLIDKTTGAVVNANKAKIGEEATGISIVEVNNKPKGDNAIYDLSGRRVVKPTKGLYIVNGRKVVMK